VIFACGRSFGVGWDAKDFVVNMVCQFKVMIVYAIAFSFRETHLQIYHTLSVGRHLYAPP
jgi:hypothetical protein